MQIEGKGYAGLIGQFLSELCDRYANDGCNDFYLDDTPDNRRLIELAHMWNEGAQYVHDLDGFDEHRPTSDGWLATGNGLICGYLAYRCELLAEQLSDD